MLRSDGNVSRREVMAAGAIGAAALTLPRWARAQQPAAPKAPDVSGPSAAKDAKAQPAGFYRFKIGSLEALALSDGSSRLAPVHPMMAPEASKEIVEKTLEAHFLPADGADIQFNVLCVKIGAETILIDSGSGAGRGGTMGKLVPNMAAAGIRPEQITAVLISHAHGDHVGGLLSGEAPAFPNARVFIGKAEHDFWTGAPDLSKSRLGEDMRKGMIGGAQKALAGVKPKLELVKGGDKILGGLELIDTPGHTPGHMSVVVSDGKDQVVAMGDLAHNHVLMFENPSWTIAFDADPVAAAEMRKKMFERFASDRARVFAYHLPWPGLGHIAPLGHRPRMEPGYAWSIEPWSWGG